MRLSNSDKKRYRRIGHNLNPVLIIAQKGLSENISAEIQRALTEHELIKIKLITSTREEKKALTDTICDEFSAESGNQPIEGPRIDPAHHIEGDVDGQAVDRALGIVFVVKRQIEISI